MGSFLGYLARPCFKTKTKQKKKYKPARHQRKRLGRHFMAHSDKVALRTSERTHPGRRNRKCQCVWLVSVWWRTVGSTKGSGMIRFVVLKFQSLLCRQQMSGTLEVKTENLENI